MKLTLEVLADTICVCKLSVNQEIPTWAYQGGFFSITKTADELSIACSEAAAPEDVLCERGWKAFKVQGTLAFGLVGILSKLTTTFAEAGIGIFAISTYNTDYILVKTEDFDSAAYSLRIAGHEIIE